MRQFIFLAFLFSVLLKPASAQSDGIAGYDLLSPSDRVFAFDYDSSGKQDHLVLYRPGAGVIWILKNSTGTFIPVYTELWSPNASVQGGIGGYDLASTSDQAFSFDYDSTGKQDHLVLYRPGSGIFWILKNDHGIFSPVWTDAYGLHAPGGGIAGYDLLSPNDRVFALDYDSSGKQDHLVLYRPGSGIFWVLKNNSGTFTAVWVDPYSPNAAGGGVGGYDLGSPADRAFAFDYDSTGKQDHVVLYRPGTGNIWVLKNNNGTFTPVWQEAWTPGAAIQGGIGGYDLASSADRVFAYDYDGSGKQDHLALYRPGTGTIWILKNTSGTFKPVWEEAWTPNVPVEGGIGGYDLASSADQVFAFDYDGSGKQDHLVLYRPGTGIIWILKKGDGTSGCISFCADYISSINPFSLSSPAREYIHFNQSVIALETPH